MKLSLRVQDHRHQKTQSTPHHNPLLLRAKLPITVFGLPFLSSAAAATDSSDLSFSLRTNFSSGPSLKFSYTPTAAASATTTAIPPFTLTLSSGVGLFGSPRNSPLIISANFTLSPQNPNPNPTFSLQIKPQFGDFSLRKTTSSPPNPNPKSNCGITSMGFVPLERPGSWKDLMSDSYSENSVFSGISVKANTALPVTKRVAMNFRWGVNIPSDIRKSFPFLSVSKIGLERIEEVKEVIKGEKVGDFELLKGMCISVGRQLESLQKENREIKQCLEELKFRKSRGLEWTHKGYSDGVMRRTSTPSSGTQNFGEFEHRNVKKSGVQDNGRKESKNNSNDASDLESELQRAIKAASAQ